MYCKYCGKKIPDGVKFCTGCGKSVMPKKKKSKLPAVALTMVAILVLAISGPADNDADGTDDQRPTSPPVTVAATLSEREQFIVDFCESGGFSADCAESVYDFLYDSLCAREIKFSGQNTVGNINWDISTDGFRLMVAADEDGIYRVTCGDYVMYEGESVMYTCEDLALRDTSEHRYAYTTIAKEIVKGALKAPSTAKFQSDYDMTVARNGDLVAVQGYVDAQNSFGAMIRDKFIVEFYVHDITVFSYTTQFIQVGTETAGEFISLD